MCIPGMLQELVRGTNRISKGATNDSMLACLGLTRDDVTSMPKGATLWVYFTQAMKEAAVEYLAP